MEQGDSWRHRFRISIVRACGHVAFGAGLLVLAALWVLALHGSSLVKAIDLAGVFCCAYVGASGAWASISAQRNVIVRFGIVIACALLSGCGGGALLRNPILYSDYVPYFARHPEYLAMIGLAAILSVLDLQLRIAQHDDIAFVADAIATSLFALAAAQIALQRFGPGGPGVVYAIFASFITAVGGGIIRDLILDLITGRFRGFFATVCSPYRWSALFGSFAIVSLLTHNADYAWIGAVLTGTLAYLGRNLRLA